MAAQSADTKTVTIEVTKTINNELFGTSKEFDVPRNFNGYLDMGEDECFALCQEAYTERLRGELVKNLVAKVTGKEERKKAAKQIRID